MNNKQFAEFQTKATLSTMWIFVLLLMLFRDIHEFFRPGFAQQMVDGVVNGSVITNETMLIAGIVLTIPISMVLLSRILPSQYSRWTNITLATFFIPAILSFGVYDMDDVWFMAMEIIGLLAIVVYAWRWQLSEPTLDLIPAS